MPAWVARAAIDMSTEDRTGAGIGRELARTIDVTELIDRASFSLFQLRTAALCAVIAMIDGFDTQAIAFVVPALAHDWNVDVASFGSVFAAGLLGLAIGAFCFGPIADRFGRKRVILICTGIVGVFALQATTAGTIPELLLWRFLTGVGLGGAMPNIIALTSEYTPARLRATLITLMFCGFPLGSTLGGLLATYLVPAWGWRSVFWLGGALPLVLLGALVIWLPESVYYLLARGGSSVGAAKLLQRIAPSEFSGGGERCLTAQHNGQQGFPVRLLFTPERRPITLLLWLAFFMSLLVMYFLVNWMPALFSRAGLPVRAAIISTSILNLGGVVGAIVLGRVIDRVAAHRALAAAYAAAACFIVLIAFAGTELRVLVPGLFFTGFGVVGAQIGMNALAAGLYPAAIRSTGVGWALGVGRIGSIVGPTVGGWLLALGWTPGSLFALAALPAFIAAISVAALGVRQHVPVSRESGIEL